MPSLGVDEFRSIDLSDVVGGASAAVKRVPTASGVYSFFRKIKLNREDDSGEFVKEVLAYVDQPAARPHSTKCGPLHNISLESASTLSEKKLTQLHDLSSNAEFRAYLARVLSAASMLQSPMYVGKADDLQSRISQHLDPSSELATRLRQAGIVFDEAILVYTVIEESEQRSDSVLFLVEEIVSRICRPGFVLRIG